jgi:hypothetical protein
VRRYIKKEKEGGGSGDEKEAERRDTGRKRTKRSNMGRKRTKRILKREGSVEEKGDKCKYGYFMNQIWARTKAHRLITRSNVPCRPGNNHSYFQLLPLKHREYVKRFVSLRLLNLIDTRQDSLDGHQPVARPLPTQNNTHTE